MIIVIPAREGSKGLMHKNRKLFKYTADTIPDDMKDKTYVISDDIEIMYMAGHYGFSIISRPSTISIDTTSTKEVMEYFIKNVSVDPNEDVCMLYLTYPERTWEDIDRAWEYAFTNNAYSVLCKKEVDTSPFLMLKEEDGNRGSQLFYHDLYRRQDYPKCFEISHFVAIFKPCILNKLNSNLYCRDTIFMDIKNNTIDVDTQRDLDKLDD